MYDENKFRWGAKWENFFVGVLTFTIKTKYTHKDLIQI